MGPASAAPSIGLGYVVEAGSPIVQLRKEGGAWLVCRKLGPRGRWAEVVAVTKTKKMANLLFDYLKKTKK